VARAPGRGFAAGRDVGFSRQETHRREVEMSLAIVAALTGVCFAGAVAAITFGLSR